MQKEQELIEAVEKVIRHTQAGDAPDDAVYKVASESNYGPAMIARMVESFNKSKSVYIFKTATAEERRQPFVLADTANVLERMYPVTTSTDAGRQKKASDELPDVDFSEIDFTRIPGMQKIAADTRTDIPPARIDSRTDTLKKYYQHKEACEKLERSLYEDHMNARQVFDRVLETCVEHVHGMANSKFQKVARCVVNGYPDTGRQLIGILAKRTRKDISGLEKTANAAVFPAQEPYLSITRLYDVADTLIRTETALNQFRQKKADSAGLLADLLSRNQGQAMTAGGALSPEHLGEILSSPFRQRVKGIEEALDPEFYNRRKALQTRKAFVELLLFDKDISQYDDLDVIQAYNDAVTSIPGLEKKPNMLRNMVLRNLQTGGVKDVFEMKTEAELAEKLQKGESAGAAEIRQQLLEEDSRKSRGEDYVHQDAKAGNIADYLVAAPADIGKKVSGWGDVQLKKREDAAKESTKKSEVDAAAYRKRVEDLAEQLSKATSKAVTGRNRSGLSPGQKLREDMAGYYRDPSRGPVVKGGLGAGIVGVTPEEARRVAQTMIDRADKGTMTVNEASLYNRARGTK